MIRYTHYDVRDIDNERYYVRKVEHAAAINRLASYENIGLSPLQILYILDHYVTASQLKEVYHEVPY